MGVFQNLVIAEIEMVLVESKIGDVEVGEGLAEGAAKGAGGKCF